MWFKESGKQILMNENYYKKLTMGMGTMVCGLFCIL